MRYACFLNDSAGKNCLYFAAMPGQTISGRKRDAGRVLVHPKTGADAVGFGEWSRQ